MSDSPAPTNSSTDSPSTEAGTTAAGKPRTSWIGRIVIGILLVVLATEAFAHLRFSAAKKKLDAELAKAEATDYAVTPEKVKEVLGGREPDLSKRRKVAVGEELYNVYYFKGLLKNRVLCAHYGVQGEDGTEGSQRELMDVLTVVPEEILYEK